MRQITLMATQSQGMTFDDCKMSSTLGYLVDLQNSI